MTNAVNCYAVRRLNPFQGVVEVVAMDGARALSLDGRRWEIQALAERPDHTWHSLGAGAPIRQFFRFGIWDPARGLRSVPANPLLDLGAMQQAAGALIDRLSRSLADIPFPLTDHYELWLTDAQGEPLAQLASTTDRDHLSDFRAGRWQACPLQEHGFASPTLTARGIPAHDGHNPRRHAQELEQLVHRTATGTARWFQRQPDAGARPLDDAGGVRQLPELPIREHWQEAWQIALVGDYIDWLAPALLTLPQLSTTTRTRLEKAAARRALALDAAYPLYPEVIDRTLLDTARVEARLRRSRESG